MCVWSVSERFVILYNCYLVTEPHRNLCLTACFASILPSQYRNGQTHVEDEPESAAFNSHQRIDLEVMSHEKTENQRDEVIDKSKSDTPEHTHKPHSYPDSS